MKKFGVCFGLFFLMLMSSAFADSDYWNIGSNESQFSLGRGIFSQVDELGLSYYTAGLTDAKRIPLVADADGNGVSEIYVMDDDEVKVYEGIELDFKASFDYSSGTPRPSYPILFDIDGDNDTEYIFADESRSPYPEIFILSYNGTDLVNETSYQDADFGIGDSIITCIDANKCLYVANEYYNSEDLPAVVDVIAVSFNSTDDIDKVTLFSDSSASDVLFCRPDVPYISHGVKNNVDYYYVSFIDATVGGGNAGVYIAWVIVDDDNQLILDNSEYIAETFSISGSGNCNDHKEIRSKASSPLANEGLLSDVGYELVVAYQTSASEFRMMLYDNDGNFQDDFPETDDSNGILVSNVFMADVFPQVSTLGRTFCVVGWDFEDEQQTLTCGSKFKSGLAETNEYVWSIPDGYNNSVNSDLANSVCHSGQQSNALTDSIDLDEFLTTYGVFSVDDDSCSFSVLLGKYLCSATREFQNGAGLSALISIDLEHIGNDDLLAMTDTALYLLDDGITNGAVDEVDVYFNPCPTDTIIKVNETMLITITGYDSNSDYGLDNDLLEYNVTIYKDTTNEQKGTYGNITSGSPRTFTFPLNKTIASGIIEITVTDNVNDPYVIEQTFSVGLDGIEYGDAVCTNSYTDVEAGESCTIDDDCDSGYSCIGGECVESSGECEDDGDCPDGFVCVSQTDGTKECKSENLIKRSVNEFDGLLHIGSLSVWLLIMILMDIILVMEANKYFRGMDSRYLFAIITALDLIWIVLGVIATVLSYWIILLLILIGVIVGVVFAVHKFEGITGG